MEHVDLFTDSTSMQNSTLDGARKLEDVDRIYTDHDMTYIETPYMNYDLTGLAILGRYKDHPSVQANSYLYLLDTTTVGAGFLEKFKALSSMGYKERQTALGPLGRLERDFIEKGHERTQTASQSQRHFYSRDWICHSSCAFLEETLPEVVKLSITSSP